MNFDNASVSSSSYLLPSNSQRKDYQAAFASLQSLYGFSGMAPAHQQSSKNSRGVKASKSSSNNTSHSSQPSNPSSSRNWEASLAALQSSYGFSGAAPSWKSS